MRGDWIEIELNEIVSKLGDGLHGTPKYSSEGDYYFINGNNLSNGKIIIKENTKKVSKDEYEKYKKSLNHRTVFVSINGTIGNLAFYNNENVILGKSACYFNLLDAVNKDFIRYLLSGQGFLNYAFKTATGSTIKNVPLKAMRAYKVPLPPLPEQRAIVAKIEELFSDLDNGIADLKKAQEQLKIYRQAVLKKAFEGELTREWREKRALSGVEVPTAEELLKQIKEERQKHYNQQLEDWEKAVKEWEDNGKEGKKPSKPRKANELPPLSKDELNELSKLPNSMVWTNLGNIVWSVKDGPHYSPKYTEAGIPFISGGNIKPTGIDFNNVKYISRELHIELSRRCKPEINDILYTKGGTTGIARVNTYDIDFNVWVHVAVLKPIEMIMPFYLQHVLNSTHCYRQSQKYTHGVGNQDLGLTRMIFITLPICSIEEQHQIVREIESRLSVCDKVEESIVESLEKAKALRQSILKKAFEGRLLSEAEVEKCKQAPDYEPASVLLERD